MKDEKLLTTPVAAKELNMREANLRAKLRSGTLNYKKIDDRYLIVRDKAYLALLEIQKNFPKQASKNVSARLDEIEEKVSSQLDQILNELADIKANLAMKNRRTK